MSSLNPKDRASLCLFTYEDGRRCRTPRIDSHPHFCFYHAQKEAHARTTETLGKDLARFFSGDYLSACDLSTALSRLIPAVIRGEVKPRVARTVAYMFQTLLQSIHVSQDEYINAFSTDGWRRAVRKSVNSNYDYRFPPKPGAPKSASTPVQSPPPPTAPTPAPPPVPTSTSRPPTSTAVGAGLARPDHPTEPTTAVTQPPAPPTTSTPQPPGPARSSHGQAEAALSVARSLFPTRPSSTPPQSGPPTANPAPQACNPERSEGPRHDPAPSTTNDTRLPSAPDQTPQPATPPAPPPPQPRPTTPNRDYAAHFDDSYHLTIDGKPW